MTAKYIIVEGEYDKRLLTAILPDLSAQVKLVSAGGYSAALSKAATVLSYLHLDALLAVDADTSDEQALAEKAQFVEDYLRSSRNGNQFELVLFAPTLADQLLGYETSPSTWPERPVHNERKVRLWEEALNRSVDFTKYQDLPAIRTIMRFAGS